MTQILWLASYPKSGNTWVRALLANYLADEPAAYDIDRLAEISYSDARRSYFERAAAAVNLPFNEAALARLRPAVHRLLAAARPGRVLVKTHTWFGAVGGVATISRDVSEGAVYIVRNPLDMVVSFADHYGLAIDNAIKATAFPALDLKPGGDTVRQRIGDWSGHVASWRDARELKRLVVRYEDLAADAAAAFRQILEFLGEAPDESRLQRAVAHASFATLASQEAAHGFSERSKSASRFFRSGVVGGWRSVLTHPQAEAVIARHRPMMTALGYLDGSGKLTV